MLSRYIFFAMVVIGIAIGVAVPDGKHRQAPPAANATASDEEEDVPVDTVLDRGPSGHFTAVADVNKEPIRFVVDTGADTVALTMDDAKRAHVKFDPANFEVIGKGASGDVRGEEVQIDSIVLDGKRATNVSAVVLEGGDVSLLGHTYLRHLSDVQIKGDQMILRD